MYSEINVKDYLNALNFSQILVDIICDKKEQLIIVVQCRKYKIDYQITLKIPN